MDLQTRILKDYRALYPGRPLRVTADQTGIQLTRVFRIFNGSPMKLHEYECFHRLVHGDPGAGSHDGAFKRACEEMLRTFGKTDLDLAARQLEKRVRWHRLIHGPQPAPHVGARSA